MPLSNVPCPRITPHMLIDLCDYEWALPLIERHLEMLTPPAIKKMQQHEWADSLLRQLPTKHIKRTEIHHSKNA